TFSLTVGAACAFSLGIAGQVLTFRTEPGRASRCLHAGCRSVGIRTSTELIPEDGSASGFDITYPETRHQKLLRNQRTFHRSGWATRSLHLIRFRRFRSSLLRLASLDLACRDH